MGVGPLTVIRRRCRRPTCRLEAQRFEGSRKPKPAQNRVAHFDLCEMASSQAIPREQHQSLRIALSHAGNLCRYVNRLARPAATMFTPVCRDGDQHVGFTAPASASDEHHCKRGAHLENIVRAARAGSMYDGNIVALCRELLGNAETDLPCAANDDLHADCVSSHADKGPCG